MNDTKTQKSLKEFCENPYWKEYYDSAPSIACKRYIELGFYYSSYLGQISDYDEYKKETDKLETEFSGDDWEYLYRHCANNPRKAYYKSKITGDR